MELVTWGQERLQSMGEWGVEVVVVSTQHSQEKQFGAVGAVLLLRPLTERVPCLHRLHAVTQTHTLRHTHTHWHAACWVDKFKHAITGENMPKQQI